MPPPGTCLSLGLRMEQKHAVCRSAVLSHNCDDQQYNPVHPHSYHWHGPSSQLPHASLQPGSHLPWVHVSLCLFVFLLRCMFAFKRT